MRRVKLTSSRQTEAQIAVQTRRQPISGRHELERGQHMGSELDAWSSLQSSMAANP